MSFKDINQDTISEVMDLFGEGKSPGLAYRTFCQKFKMKYPNEVERVVRVADRSVFPKRTDFNYLYTKYIGQKYGSSTEEMLKILEGMYIY